jgi:uncharacterized membrane protein
MDTMGKTSLNILLVSIAVLSWGMGGFFSKKSIMHSNPLIVACLIATAAFIVEVPILLLILKISRIPIHLNKHVIGYSFLIELCYATASLAFLFLVQDNETGWAVSITSIYPVVTLIFCSLFLKEPVTPSNIMGILVIVIGLVILNH